MFKMKHAIVPVSLALVLLASVCFGANTYHVSPTGSDSNPGTLASPWKTLAKAVSSVSSGDTVYLRAGTWKERLDIRSKNFTSYVTFAGYPGDPMPVLDGTGIIPQQYEDGVVWIQSSSYVRIQGLYITKAPKTGIGVIKSHHIEILNNTTWDTVRAGITCWTSHDVIFRGNDIGLSNNIGPDEVISVAAGSYNVEVSYNTLHHGSSIPDGYAGGEGINIKDGCSYVYIHHNIVHLDNRPDGRPSNRYSLGVDAWSGQFGTTHHIYFYNNISYNNGIGIVVEAEATGGITDTVFIYNNIFYNNVQNAFYMPTWALNESNIKRNVYFYNNTLYGNPIGIQISTSKVENLIIQNNIISNSRTAISIGGGVPIGQITQDHNLTVGDMKFANASAGDFHLLVGSPAIDAGIPVSAVTKDFDDVGRPKGTGYDIGAYEYVEGGGEPAPPSNLRILP